MKVLDFRVSPHLQLRPLFSQPSSTPPHQEDWHAFNFVVDVCFLLDLAARFLTAYHDEYADTVVYHPLSIARNYARGLLVFDLIASVPLTIVSLVESGARVEKVGGAYHMCTRR